MSHAAARPKLRWHASTIRTQSSVRVPAGTSRHAPVPTKNPSRPLLPPSRASAQSRVPGSGSGHTYDQMHPLCLRHTLLKPVNMHRTIFCPAPVPTIKISKTHEDERYSPLGTRPDAKGSASVEWCPPRVRLAAPYTQSKNPQVRSTVRRYGLLAGAVRSQECYMGSE